MRGWFLRVYIPIWEYSGGVAGSHSGDCMILSLFALVLASRSAQQSPVRISVQVDAPISQVSPTLYGIFFEEINQAGEGGLYAELIRNRGMEDGSASTLPRGWAAFKEGGRGA